LRGGDSMNSKRDRSLLEQFREKLLRLLELRAAR
jgi:hypothetical protein